MDVVSFRADRLDWATMLSGCMNIYIIHRLSKTLLKPARERQLIMVVG